GEVICHEPTAYSRVVRDSRNESNRAPPSSDRAPPGPFFVRDIHPDHVAFSGPEMLMNLVFASIPAGACYAPGLPCYSGHRGGDCTLPEPAGSPTPGQRCHRTNRWPGRLPVLPCGSASARPGARGAPSTSLLRRRKPVFVSLPTPVRH